MKKPRTLKDCREHPLTEELWQEDDDYWLTLVPGWIGVSTECHTLHEWNVKDLCEALMDLEPCTCQDCYEQQELLDLRTEREVKEDNINEDDFSHRSHHSHHSQETHDA